MEDVIHWEDFDLRIEADGSQVRCDCRAGQALGPFDADLVRSLVETPGSVSSPTGPKRDLAHAGAARRDQTLGHNGGWAGLRETGDRLFRALISGSVKSRFDHCRGAIASDSGRGLRIRLRLDGAKAAVRRLQELPWETLYCEETRTFFALDRRSSIVRYLEVPVPIAPLTAKPPLKALLVAASPAGLEPLALDREQRLLSDGLKDRAELSLEKLDLPELGALRQRLLDGRFQILHFMGHGELDEATGEGRLFLQSRDGTAAPISATELALRLRGVAGPRLVVLNACESAATSCRDEAEPFLGLAHALVLAGVPAVVAMRRPVADTAAIAFAETFYGRLAAGDQVDAALTEARLAMQDSEPESDEWTIPVLFMRVTDGRLIAATGSDEELPSPRLAPAATEVEIEDVGGEDNEIEGVVDTGQGRRGPRRVWIGGIHGRRNKVRGIVDSRED